MVAASFHFVLAKLLLLDICCENIFALSIVTALIACPFSINKFAKMSVFLCENRKNSLATEIASTVLKMFQIQSNYSENAYEPVTNFARGRSPVVATTTTWFRGTFRRCFSRKNPESFPLLLP